MERDISKEQAEKELKKGYADAEKILNDSEKLDKFFDDLSNKIKSVPVVGEVFSNVPTLASMIKAYSSGDYKEPPVGTILALISALCYFIFPVDLVPDFIPVAGLLDDAAVLTACIAMCKSDIDNFVIWKQNKSNENIIQIESKIIDDDEE